MAARRILILTLAVAMQLLAWREAVPVCASMAHCSGSSELRPQSAPLTTIGGTADCCKGGSVEARAAVSPPPQRIQSASPAQAVALALEPLESKVVVRGRATVEASPPLPPLLSSCILRI